MRFKVNKENIEIIETDVVNKGEYNLTKCEFEFSEEYTHDLVKIAIFTNSIDSYRMLIDPNGKCDIPYEITNVEDHYLLGVYAYKLQQDGETLDLRYSPKGVYLEVIEGSYREANESEAPSDIITQLTKRINEVAIEVDDLSDFVDSINNKVNSHTDSIADINSTLSSHTSAINSLDSRVTTNETNISTNATNISNLRTYVDNGLTSTLNTAKDYTNDSIARDFKDISYNGSTATMVFTRHDDTTFTIDLPLESTVKDGRYDSETTELVLVLMNDQEIRIPVGSLIDIYTGSETATIQVTVDNQNVISAVIKSGSVSKTLLTTELKNEIDAKLEQSDLTQYVADNIYTKTQTNTLLNDKVDKIKGYSLVSDTEISRLANVDNYDDTEIKSDISNLGDEVTTIKSTYSLITETGSQISLNIDNADYKITAILKDKNGNTIYTSNVIDLPLESVVVNGSYDSTTKEVVLTLQGGSTIRFSVADLVSGLVSETDLNATLENYYTKTQANGLLDNKVDKVTGKELSTNDFTDSYKDKLDELENYDDTEIRSLIDGKVDKVTGKGLSTEDYTTNEKTKLSSIETGAQVNVLESIEVNGVEQTITDKTIDITIPTTLASLSDDSTHRLVTDTEKSTWNAKADTSDIPDVSDFIDKDVNNLTYYTLATDTGSTIELSIDSSTYVMTLNLKNSAGTTISTDDIDLPLETMVVGASYDSLTKEIVITLKSGATTRFSVADLVSGLQSEITSTNKLNSDLVDDTSSTNKFVTSAEKTTWNNKSDFSGDYDDLTNKPTIPVVPTNVSAFTNDAGYLTTHQDISGKEDKSNKVTSISSSSTDTQYPSAKCVYDIVGDIASTLDAIQREVI